MKSQVGEMRIKYDNFGGYYFEITVQNISLDKYEVIRDPDPGAVIFNADAKAREWDNMLARRLEEQRAYRGKRRASGIYRELKSVLVDGLDASQRINWKELKEESTYPFGKPQKPVIPPSPPLPDNYPPKPLRDNFAPEFGPFDKIIPSMRAQKEKEAADRYEAALAAWKRTAAEIDKAYRAKVLEHEKKVAEIKADYQQKLAEWEEKVRPYFAREPEAVLEYCETILSNSKYPSYLTRSFDLGYNPETQVLVVDYQLPSFTSIQSLNEVWYVNENTEDRLSESELNQLYDNLLYMIALRTLHELFHTDIAGALTTIAFNGYVQFIDAAIGHQVNACMLSLLVTKEEFSKLNLRNVDPEACFKWLKGVASSKLHSLTPIAPILKIDRDDARFVTSYSVVDAIQEGDNLAGMTREDFKVRIREFLEDSSVMVDREDFEISLELILELFEEEFSDMNREDFELFIRELFEEFCDMDREGFELFVRELLEEKFSDPGSEVFGAAR